MSSQAPHSFKTKKKTSLLARVFACVPVGRLADVFFVSLVLHFLLLPQYGCLSCSKKPFITSRISCRGISESGKTNHP